MDYLGLRVRSFSGGMNRQGALLLEEAATVWYHLAPPCLPDLISSAPVQQVYQQAWLIETFLVPLCATQTLPSV